MHLVCPTETLIELTRLNPFERFPHGRPRVPDDVLDRKKPVTTEEAWDTLRKHGCTKQFAGDWFVTHPDCVLVGRAVTAVFVPKKPYLYDLIEETGQREGRIGGQNSWVNDTLESGDVLVIDMFGKVEIGPFVGDNLATSVRRRTMAGAVIEGTIRDYQGIRRMSDVTFFCRGVHPSCIFDVTLLGINLPVRIGEATVLPGDVVLGTPTGVVFIPPHLATDFQAWKARRAM